jgi:hypothetical protein
METTVKKRGRPRKNSPIKRRSKRGRPSSGKTLNQLYLESYYRRKHKIMRKHTCECGSTITHDKIQRHKKSLKHQKWEEKQVKEQPEECI